MAEFIYPSTGKTVYASELWVCVVCFCVTYYIDKEEHQAWHRTLTNRPREEGT